MPDTSQAPTEFGPTADTLAGGVRISAAGHAQIIIYGDVVGGDKVVHIDRAATVGDEVRLAERRPTVRRRSAPVSIRPRPFPDLLDRQVEVATARQSLRTAACVSIYGETGIGKTALLRHLAHLNFDGLFPDGVYYHTGRRLGLADLLQALFDAFYESDAPVKPDSGEIHRRLQDVRALVIFDDLELPREDVEALLNTAPNCAFLLASPTRMVWGEGQTVSLSGLPLAAALQLFEREFGQSLTPEERFVAEALCTALGGRPLDILQSAALAQEEGRSLADVARIAQGAAPAEALAEEAAAELTDDEEKALATLAALGGAAPGVQHIAAISGVSKAPQLLDALAKRHLVQIDGSRYALAANVAAQLETPARLTRWRIAALEHYARWAHEHVGEPERLLEEADVLQHVAQQALKAERPSDALRIVRSLQSALAGAGRWDAWAEMLQLGLEAARVLGDRAAEAWALHQLGTRALCLGKVGPAQNWLAEALRLRVASGDRAGAAVTRTNLDLVRAPPVIGPKRSFRRCCLFSALGIAVLMLLVGLGGLVLWECCLRPVPLPPRATAIRAPSQTLVATSTATTTTVTPTSLPTDTPQATGTLTPTWTPTTSGPPPAPDLPTIQFFSAKPARIFAGQAVTMTCQIQGATRADIGGVAVDAASCGLTVFPTVSAVYTLRACSAQAADTCAWATTSVTVLPTPTPSPTPTRTPTPTWTPTSGPPPLSAPVPITPTGGASISCTGVSIKSMTVTLSWTASTGNVNAYIWFIERWIASTSRWGQVANGSVAGTTDTTTINDCTVGEDYRWAVAASGEGGTGYLSTGPLSDFAYFGAG